MIPTTAIEGRCHDRLTRIMPHGPGATIDAACARVAAHRGRPIRVVVTDPGDLDLPSGLWLHSEQRELIWVDSRTSLLHRTAIIGHELGHMLCEHEPSVIDSPLYRGEIREFAIQFCPDLSADLISAMMGRCFTAPQSDEDRVRELEAEFVGRQLVAHVLRRQGASLTQMLCRG